MPRARRLPEVQAVLRLKSEGFTDREVSLGTGVPLTTIRAWRNHGLPKRAKRALDVGGICPRCGCDPHDFSALPAETYAYLLALYLGDVLGDPHEFAPVTGVKRVVDGVGRHPLDRMRSLEAERLS